MMKRERVMLGLRRDVGVWSGYVVEIEFPPLMARTEETAASRQFEFSCDVRHCCAYFRRIMTPYT